MLPGFTVEAGSQFQAAIDLDLVNAQSNAIDNVYDYSGNRIQKSYTTGLKRYYIRGVGGKTLAVLDENGAELFYNLRGLDLLGQYDVATGAKVYFLKDHLGNIRVTVDDNGNVMGYNDYYPFGLQMPRRIYNGGLANNLYKYSSKELDEESNLDWYSFGARFYDPEIARWHVTDPAGQSFSPYSYVGNSPLINVDPDGRRFHDKIGDFLDNTLGAGLRFVGGGIHNYFEGRYQSNAPGFYFSPNPGIITDNGIPFGLASENVPGLQLPRTGPCLPGVGTCTGEVGLKAQSILNSLRGGVGLNAPGLVDGEFETDGFSGPSIISSV